MPTKTLGLTPGQSRALFALDTSGTTWRKDLLMERVAVTADELQRLVEDDLIKCEPNVHLVTTTRMPGVRLKLTRRGLRKICTPEWRLLAILANEGGHATLHECKVDKTTLTTLVEAGLIGPHCPGERDTLSVAEAKALAPREVEVWLTLRGRSFVPHWSDAR